MKKKIIFSSALTMLMAASMMVGASYALFTSESKADITVSSGKVDFRANIDESSLELVSFTHKMSGNTFENGGTANINGNSLVLDKITPGDKATFSIEMLNYSNVNIKYKIKLNCESGYDLFSLLKINTADFETPSWTSLQPDSNPDSPSTKKEKVVVELPGEVGNQAQGLSAKMNIVVEAVQGNADIPEESIRPQVTTDTGTTLVSQENADPVVVKTNKGSANVVVPASRVEGQEIKVDIRPATVEEEGAFTLEGNQDAVYYDIDVTGLNQTEEDVEVSMFIGKNLSDIVVLHNTNTGVEKIDGSTYDPTTGYVTFTTKTFSVFAIQASPLLTVEYGRSASTRGKNLAKAIENAPDVAVIKLSPGKEYELQDTIEIYKKDITLVGGEGTVITRDETNPTGAEVFFALDADHSYLTLRNLTIKDNYEDLADGSIAPLMVGRNTRQIITTENVNFETEVEGFTYRGSNPAKVPVKDGFTCFANIDKHDANVGHVDGFSAVVIENSGKYRIMSSENLGLQLYSQKEFILPGDMYVITGTLKDEYSNQLAIRLGYYEPLTLNLNNHNISYAYDTRWNFEFANATMFALEAKDNFTIKGEGLIDAVLPNVYSYGVLVGTIPNYAPIMNVNGPTIIAHTNQVSEGTLNIENGTFKYPEGFTGDTETPSGTMRFGYLLNCLDANYKAHKAKINVTGGTFFGFDPANNTAEGPATNFVSEGFISTPSENKFVVTPKI